ncbi:MAG: serine hydrolase [Burkholderiaceae bacterium]|nr:serine hydrolase [Burkholderiaceae bacterium]
MNAPLALVQASRPPDAIASCPARLGWMVGSPPPPERQIRFADGSAYRFPQLRWSFAHLPSLVPTAVVPRGCGPAWPLPRAERDDVDDLAFTPLHGGTAMSWAASLAANYTDAIVVLHRGRIVHERYFGVMAPERLHTALSVTKGVLGLLAEVLIADGQLDRAAPVGLLVPELAATGFGDASVGQLLDMSTALDYSEDYADPGSGIWAHAAAGGVLPRPPGWQGPDGFRAYLRTIARAGEHGRVFAYRTVNTDALAWVLEAVTGQPLAPLLSQRLWQPLGAEHDARLSIDSQGVAFAGGGLNTTLRDLARLGELLRLGGVRDGRRIVPAAAVQRLQHSAEPPVRVRRIDAPMAGWRYRSMWWATHNRHRAFMARGVHGQALYIDPAAEMVIARYASHPLPPNALSDPTSLPAWHALAEHLIADPA